MATIVAANRSYCGLPSESAWKRLYTEPSSQDPCSGLARYNLLTEWQQRARCGMTARLP